MNTRRDALRTFAAAATALPVLNAQDHHHAEADAPASAAPPVPKPVFFTAGEMAVLTALVDLVIPRTDTPGAADARVQYAIDRAASTSARTGDRLRAGLKTLAADGFLDKDQTARVKTVAKLSDERDPFFELVKTLTVGQYYRTREGLVQELGWHGNTYLAHFEGCTHPEHQIGGGRHAG